MTLDEAIRHGNWTLISDDKKGWFIATPRHIRIPDPQENYATHIEGLYGEIKNCMLMYTDRKYAIDFSKVISLSMNNMQPLCELNYTHRRVVGQGNLGLIGVSPKIMRLFEMTSNQDEFDMYASIQSLPQ